MIKQAKRDKNAYDFAWVIFDKDGHVKIPEAFELARNSDPVIEIAFTTPCFEYFVLLHFEKTTKPFKKCDNVISQIKKKWLPDYEKASNIFETLISKKEIGIQNGKWVINQFKDERDSGKKVYELSAYSNIHELVEFLYSLI